MILLPPTSTLFPYTTLFRSSTDHFSNMTGKLSDLRIRNAKAAAKAYKLSGGHGFCVIVNPRSEEHTSELQSQSNLVCRLLLEKKIHPTRHHIRLASFYINVS